MQVVLMCLCFKAHVVRVLPGAFVERTACKLIHDLMVDHAFLNTDLALQLVEHVAVRVGYVSDTLGFGDRTCLINFRISIYRASDVFVEGVEEVGP